MENYLRIKEDKLTCRLKKLFKAQKAMVESGESIKKPCDFAKITGEINGILWVLEKTLSLKE